MQFTLYSSQIGPNGWKVAILLEELGLKYETKFLDLATGEQKLPDHTKYNPNGPVMKYLADRHDPDNRLHYPHGTNEWHLIDQWMTFQVSGAGPFFGNTGAFQMRSESFVPITLEMYQKDVARVLSVMEGVLSKQRFLIDEKLTIADLSFAPWYIVTLDFILRDNTVGVSVENFPHFKRWGDALRARPSVKKIEASWREYLDGHPLNGSAYLGFKTFL